MAETHKGDGRVELLRRTVGGIRFRITAVATLVVLVVLIVTSFLLVEVQERSLTQSLDETLEQGADLTAAAIADQGAPDDVGGFGDDDTIVQVVDLDGGVVIATDNAQGLSPILPAPDDRADHFSTVDDVPGGEGPFRVLSRTIESADGLATIHVAAPTDDITESTDALAASLIIAVPVVVAVLGLLIWLLVGRTLRPVEAIRAEVAAINASELGRRVPEPPTNDEIAGLARTMNDMLGRVEQSVARQQAFVADASHELRTPLTRMRSELEVDLAHPEQSDLAATHRSVLDEAHTLERLLDDLLHLARTDAGQPLASTTLVDLDDVVFRCVDRIDGDGRLRIDVSGVRPVQVEADGPQLTRAVGNVVDNAARYAAGAITCTLVETGGDAVLSVTDDGPGIPDDDRERVFERFTRLDDSRTSATGGVGLGLAIARDIVVRHGGSIMVEPDHGARLVIRLPRVDEGV